MVATADLLGQMVEARVPRGSIPQWVDRYGYGTRQIKNWLALGRTVGEMPPFDEPAKMAGWAERHLGRVPGRLIASIAKLTSEEMPAKAPEQDLEPYDVPDVSGEDMSVEADLARFRKSGTVAHRMHEEALQKGDFVKARQYMEQAREISAEVRQLEKLLPLARAQSDEWKRAADVTHETAALLNVLKTSLLNRGLKASSRLRAAATATDAALHQAWVAEINAVFAECCAGGFAEPLKLEA